MSSDERPGAPADLAAATGRPAEGPEAPAEPSVTETVAAQIGGVRGMVESSIPVLVFVAVNIFSDLKPALWGAVGSAVLIALFRLARRESVRHAVNGLIGVAVAALIAARTGRAEDFYLPGIVMNFLYGVAFAGSAAIRRPLVGYAWAMLVGGHPDWRARPRLLRSYGLLSIGWAFMFVGRGVAQLVLYFLAMPNALGVVRIAGTALYALMFAFTVWYGRRIVRAYDEQRTGSPVPSTA